MLVSCKHTLSQELLDCNNGICYLFMRAKKKKSKIRKIEKQENNNPITEKQENNNHTIVKYTLLSPFTRDLRLDFSVVAPVLQFTPTASHPYPGDNPPERGLKERRASKYFRVKLNHLHMHQSS